MRGTKRPTHSRRSSGSIRANPVSIPSSITSSAYGSSAGCSSSSLQSPRASSLARLLNRGILTPRRRIAPGIREAENFRNSGSASASTFSRSLRLLSIMGGIL